MSLYGNLLNPGASTAPAAGAASASSSGSGIGNAAAAPAKASHWSSAAQTSFIPSSLLRRRSGAAPASAPPRPTAQQQHAPVPLAAPSSAAAAAVAVVALQAPPAAAAAAVQPSSAMAVEDSTCGDFFDVRDEYDPASPSDYAAGLAERRRAEAAQAAAAAAALEAASQPALALPAPPAPRADNRPAWLSAAEGAGSASVVQARMDNRPAWMAAAGGAGLAPAHPPATLPAALAMGGASAAAATAAAAAAAAAAPAPEGVQSKVERMMANWGYRVGMGLGKSEAGIATPLEVRKTGKLTGRIMMARPLAGHAAAVAAAAAAAAAATAAPPPPPRTLTSRVLCVTNLGPPSEDPEDGLEDDVREEVEAQGLGPVETCFLYQVAPAPVPAGHGPRVFLALSRAPAAAAAVQLLHTRRFGARRACAFLFEEQRLANWALHPTEEEVRMAAALE